MSSSMHKFGFSVNLFEFVVFYDFDNPMFYTTGCALSCSKTICEAIIEDWRLWYFCIIASKVFVERQQRNSNSAYVKWIFMSSSELNDLSNSKLYKNEKRRRTET